ncbi:MAG: hypothetical protein FJ280_01045 [Planctomycetes bacterium]|nr:hypothetical protein [Verrucomicrobiota bacterium]MBM4023986.1 hypothetical protein [Planctomycetota bacterium]
MTAKEAFGATINRARGLIALHQELCPIGAPRQEYADILRAAVVFAVSAMDAYFHDKIGEKVVPLVRMKAGRNLPGKLVETIRAGTTHDRLIEIMLEERPLAHVATIVRRSLADATIQNVGKIDNALKVLGCEDAWFHAAKTLGTSRKKIKKIVQPYVDRRHDIVHEGDLGKGKKNKHSLKRITRPYTATAVDRIENFVQAVDGFIDSKIP